MTIIESPYQWIQKQTAQALRLHFFYVQLNWAWTFNLS